MSFGILESYHENAAGDCGEHWRSNWCWARIVLWQVAESCQRLYHRHQRGDSDSFAGILALRVVQRRSSITSKYVLRVKGRHIWNPSNFGISVMLFLAAETVASLSIQWGNYLLPMVVIWVLGSVIIWRLRRFHITAIYVVVVCGVRICCAAGSPGSPWQSEIAPITGPMYQLFIFFMITDPKTTVRSKTGQCVVVFLVALVEMVLRLDQVVYAPLYALFIVGPAAMLVEMWLDSRKSSRAGGDRWRVTVLQRPLKRFEDVRCASACLMVLVFCRLQERRACGGREHPAAGRADAEYRSADSSRRRIVRARKSSADKATSFGPD